MIHMMEIGNLSYLMRLIQLREAVEIGEKAPGNLHNLVLSLAVAYFAAEKQEPLGFSEAAHHPWKLLLRML